MRKLLTIFLLICLITTSAFGQWSGVKPMLGEQINRAHISGDPVAAWFFNEGIGPTVFDLSGTGNTGTFAGDPQWVPGKFGSALDFDGTGDCVLLGDDFTSSDDFTIIIWCKMGAVSGSFDYLLDNSNGSVGFILRAPNWANDIDFFSYKTGPTAVNTNVSFDLTDTWHQLAITRTNVEQRIYRDAVLAATDATGAALVTTTTPLVLGGEYDCDNAAEGQIDHLMIYNRALSASEIAEQYARPFGMIKKDDVALLEAGIPAVGVVPTPYYYRGFIPLPLIFLTIYCYKRRRKCAA